MAQSHSTATKTTVPPAPDKKPNTTEELIQRLEALGVELETIRQYRKNCKDDPSGTLAQLWFQAERLGHVNVYSRGDGYTVTLHVLRTTRARFTAKGEGKTIVLALKDALKQTRKPGVIHNPGIGRQSRL